MIKVIGFDLDNTLYNQELFEFEVFEQIAKQIENDYDISSVNYFKSLKKLYIKGEKKDVFNKALKSLNISFPNGWEDYIKNIILPLYRSFIPSNLELYKDSLNYLNFFNKNGYKLVLITNGREYTQNVKINLLNIKKYFDAIFISDEFKPPSRKPCTLMFSKVLKRFNIKSHEMIYIGDDTARDKSSEKIGIKFINIRDLDLKYFSKISEVL